MNDSSMTLQEIRNAVSEFVAERDWAQFHAPKNLAMSIAIEAAELMEHFQWIEAEQSRRENLSDENLHAIGEELCDVFTYCIAMANQLEIDLSSAFEAKMNKNRAKYPADEYRGKY
ncbi:MAG: nucleotide pyrophosphohydrolase [Pirellulaceae bacterium]